MATTALVAGRGIADRRERFKSDLARRSAQFATRDR